MRRLAIDVADGEYVIVRLDPTVSIPTSIPTELLAPGQGQLLSVTRTDDEVSIICPAHAAPGAGTVERGWRLLSVRGPLEFTLTGIIAALASELAAAGVALFSLSTYDTDHVLVQDKDLARAVQALQTSGHEVHTG